MIRDASGHRRWCPATNVGQARMRCTAMVDRTDQRHAMLQRPRAACQRASSACQRGQPLTTGRVQPLAGRRVAHAVSLCPPSERLNARRRAIYNAVRDVNDAALGVALHDLCDADGAPGAQPGTPLGSRPLWIAQRLTPRPDLGAQSLGPAPPRAVGGPVAPTLDEAPHQRHVAVRPPRARPPQACAHPGYPLKAGQFGVGHVR
jgi:hypothetical protein